jgi:hypothetical protein
MSAKLLIGRLGFKRVYLETNSIVAEIPRGTERALVQMLFKGEQDNCKGGVVQAISLEKAVVCSEIAKWQR